MSLAKAISQSVSVAFEKLQTLEAGSFRYWRIRIMYASIIGYAAFYLVRSNFSMAMTAMGQEFGYDKIQLGWIITMFSVIYGIGKLINGYISDRSDSRLFMTVGLLGSAIVSFFISFSHGIAMLPFLWGLNAWFQSMGWPPAARLITHWFSPKELGTKWALWASSHQIGACAVFLIAGPLISSYGWRSAFYVPAVLALFFAFFIFNRLRDTPQELGFPPVEEYKGEIQHVDPSHSERITLKEVLPLVLKNKLVWYVSLANMCLYVPRMGIFTWAPMFLMEHKGTEITIAGIQTFAFEFAGLIGGIVAGSISDKVFNGRRGPIGALFLAALAFVFILLALVPAGHPVLDTLILFMAGFLVYGPQVLAGLAAADFASKRAAGIATGFAGVFAYTGSAIAGVGIGMIVTEYGWNGGFALFVVTSLIGALFFALTWNHRARVYGDTPEKARA